MTVREGLHVNTPIQRDGFHTQIRAASDMEAGCTLPTSTAGVSAYPPPISKVISLVLSDNYPHTPPPDSVPYVHIGLSARRLSAWYLAHRPIRHAVRGVSAYPRTLCTHRPIRHAVRGGDITISIAVPYVHIGLSARRIRRPASMGRLPDTYGVKPTQTRTAAHRTSLV